MKRIIIPFFIFFSILTNAFGTSPILIYINKDHPVRFVTNTGSVIFTLPKGHIPLDTTSLDVFENGVCMVKDDEKQIYAVDVSGNVIFTLPEDHFPVKNMDLSWFKNNICSIKSKQGEIYWINPTGELIKSFGMDYDHIEEAGDSFYLATVKNQPYKYSFLNTKGEDAFENNKFQQATPFNEGLAGVQFDNEKGSYGYIDRSGQTIIDIEKKFGGYTFSLFPFRDNLAKVVLKAKTNSTVPDDYNEYYYYINKKGETVIDLYKLFPGKGIEKPSDFNNGVMHLIVGDPVSGSRKMVFINTGGEILSTFDDAKLVLPFKNGIACFQQESGLYKRYINNYGKLLDLGINNDRTYYFETKHSDGSYFYVVFHDRDEIKYYYRLYDYKTKEIVFESTSEIVNFTDNYILKKGSEIDEFLLIDLKSKAILWTTPPHEICFTSIEKALKVKNQVNRFSFGEVSGDFSSISQFKNLKNLQIIGAMSLKSLDGMEQLENLEYLSLFEVDNVSFFPSNTEKLKKLKKIVIMNCDKLRFQVEDIVRKVPSLEYLELWSIHYQDGLKEKVKQINNNLVFDYRVFISG